MRSVKFIQTAKIGYIIMSVLFCVLGIVLCIRPEISVLWIGRILGISMIIFGIFKIVGYFSKDLFRLAFQYDMALGTLSMTLGIVTLLLPGDALTFLCIMFGVAALADGLFKLQIAMDAKAFGVSSWWLILTLAILTGAIGIVLIFRPAFGSLVLTVIFGLTLILDGILNLCVAICTVKIIRHQQPDIIDEQ